MQIIELQAKKRDGRGKGISRQLRRDGRVPAVLYGDKKDPVVLDLDARDMERILNSDTGERTILSLKIDEADKQLAMIKDVQAKTMSSQLLHLDLLRISMDKDVQVPVPLELLNPESVKRAGGILQQMLNEITVECLPDKIPEKIELDLEGLTIGDTRYVSDLEVEENITILNDDAEVIFSILAPKLKEEDEELEEGEEGEEGEAAEGAEGDAESKGKKEGDSSEG